MGPWEKSRVRTAKLESIYRAFLKELTLAGGWAWGGGLYFLTLLLNKKVHSENILRKILV